MNVLYKACIAMSCIIGLMTAAITKEGIGSFGLTIVLCSMVAVANMSCDYIKQKRSNSHDN